MADLREGLTRVVLDACAKCMTGLRDGPWRHYPESYCDTEGCHNRGQSVPWVGLREHVKVMWPAPLMACVGALIEIMRVGSGPSDPMTVRDLVALAREAVTAWDHYLEGEPAAQEER